MFFVANDGITGYELWSTDGTESGTQLFKDIRLPAQDSSNSGSFYNGPYSATPFKVVNGKMYFAANRMTQVVGSDYFPNDAYVLYSTDGTVANTDFVNIAVPPGSYLGNAPNNFLYTTNNTIMGLSEYNNELYVSNARPARHNIGSLTESGIYKINNSNPFYRVGNFYIPNAGASGASNDAPLGAMYWFNNEFYFLGIDTTTTTPSDYNLYLYKLNPQTETFTLLSTVVGASTSKSFTNLLLAKIVGNKLYYYKDYSQDIFVTDGTVTGISQAARNANVALNPNTDQNITSEVFSMGSIDNSLYFNARISSGPDALYRIFNTSLSNNGFDKETKFNMYPNPTSNNLNFKLENNNDNATIKIISITGQVVFEKQNLSGTDFNFDVSNLNAGMYIVQITDSGKTLNSKFIKQ